MSKSSSILFSLVLALFPTLAGATSYVMVSDENLVDRAELIVEVEILEVDPSPDAGRPVTDYLMAVEHVTLGDLVASPLTVRVPGGLLPDGMGLRVHGAPRFEAGQRALLFLKAHPDGTYRILHFLLGVFHLMEHDGRTVALRRISEANEVEIPGRATPRTGPRDLDRFRAWLEDRILGTFREGDYFATDPIGITEKFTLLTGSNGLPIRWPGFTSNVSYRAHSDGQPGLTGGGFSQASTAVGVWRNDANTDIRIVYSGTTTASGGLETFDGVNAFLFDDPNDNSNFEEAFTCSEGGTVAIGGPWFGGTHQHNGQTFNTAAGGDIVTNKGIDCLEDTQLGTEPWINRLRRAEEVFGHEVGHTLGLGHSCGDDESPSCSSSVLNEALMRAQLHGDNRGARLNSDDRAGIRFLYGDPVTAPNAPSNLSATAVSANEINLTWNDNSNDEESFDLERATEGGSFNRIALPAANTTSFEDTTAQPNTTYRYRIRAFNDGGASGYSNTATATTFGEIAPSNLSAFGVSDTKIRLFWDDTSIQETGFEIEGRTGGAPFALLMTVPAGSETADISGLNPITTYTFRVRAVSPSGTSGYSNEASTTTFVSNPDPCVAGPETLCLNDGRFKVELNWTDPENRTGTGKDAGLIAADSGLLYFFSANNWEILVKVLDACSSQSQQFWVFAAATTNVAYDLVVTDSISGFSKSYSNPQGVASPAILDTSAFPTCFAELPDPAQSAMALAKAPQTVAQPSELALPSKGGCVPSDTRFCFNGGRFAVEIEWRDFEGNTGFGRVNALQSEDSGLQWFFDPDNLEVLVKVLNGCGINGHVWVFSAATTNVEYTLRVTDTETDVTKEYFNELGNAADAITDTTAFQSCP